MLNEANLSVTYSRKLLLMEYAIILMTDVQVTNGDRVNNYDKCIHQ